MPKNLRQFVVVNDQNALAKPQVVLSFQYSFHVQEVIITTVVTKQYLGCPLFIKLKWQSPAEVDDCSKFDNVGLR